MNEQDKQAFEAAWGKAVLDLDGVNRDDFEDGWQAALEYARGKQEPVAWLKTWNSVGKAKEGMVRLDLKPDCEPWLENMRPTVTPLYTTPPAAEVNAQLLTALKVAKRYLNIYSQQYELAEAAIAAAEANAP